MTPFTQMSTGQREAVLRFVTERTGGRFTATGHYNTLAFYDKRGLKVAFVYSDWHGPSISLHMAARQGALWAHEVVLHHMFAYPFQQLGCRRVTSPILARNKKSVALAHALGYKQEGCLREADPAGGDLLIFGMLRSECRWVNQLQGVAVNDA